MPQVIVKVSYGKDNLIGCLVQQDPDMTDSIAAIEVASVLDVDGNPVSAWSATHPAPNEIRVSLDGHQEFLITFDTQRGTVVFTEHEQSLDLTVVFDVTLENLNRRPA